MASSCCQTERNLSQGSEPTVTFPSLRFFARERLVKGTQSGVQDSWISGLLYYGEPAPGLWLGFPICTAGGAAPSCVSQARNKSQMFRSNGDIKRLSRESSRCGSMGYKLPGIQEDAGPSLASLSGLRIGHCHELWCKSKMEAWIWHGCGSGVGRQL